MRCIQCQSQAHTHVPYPLCQAHAVEYYQSLLTIVAGRRIARNNPELATARTREEEELSRIYALRNTLAGVKGVNTSRWPWKRVKSA